MCLSGDGTDFDGTETEAREDVEELSVFVEASGEPDGVVETNAGYGLLEEVGGYGVSGLDSIGDGGEPEGSGSEPHGDVMGVFGIEMKEKVAKEGV